MSLETKTGNWSLGGMSDDDRDGSVTAEFQHQALGLFITLTGF